MYNLLFCFLPNCSGMYVPNVSSHIMENFDHILNVSMGDNPNRLQLKTSKSTPTFQHSFNLSDQENNNLVGYNLSNTFVNSKSTEYLQKALEHTVSPKEDFLSKDQSKLSALNLDLSQASHLQDVAIRSTGDGDDDTLCDILDLPEDEFYSCEEHFKDSILGFEHGVDAVTSETFWKDISLLGKPNSTFFSLGSLDFLKRLQNAFLAIISKQDFDIRVFQISKWFVIINSIYRDLNHVKGEQQFWFYPVLLVLLEYLQHYQKLQSCTCKDILPLYVSRLNNVMNVLKRKPLETCQEEKDLIDLLEEHKQTLFNAILEFHTNPSKTKDYVVNIIDKLFSQMKGPNCVEVIQQVPMKWLHHYLEVIKNQLDKKDSDAYILKCFEIIKRKIKITKLVSYVDAVQTRHYITPLQVRHLITIANILKSWNSKTILKQRVMNILKRVKTQTVTNKSPEGYLIETMGTNNTVSNNSPKILSTEIMGKNNEVSNKSPERLPTEATIKKSMFDYDNSQKQVELNLQQSPLLKVAQSPAETEQSEDYSCPSLIVKAQSCLKQPSSPLSLYDPEEELDSEKDYHEWGINISCKIATNHSYLKEDTNKAEHCFQLATFRDSDDDSSHHSPISSPKTIQNKKENSNYALKDPRFSQKHVATSKYSNLNQRPLEIHYQLIKVDIPKLPYIKYHSYLKNLKSIDNIVDPRLARDQRRLEKVKRFKKASQTSLNSPKIPPENTSEAQTKNRKVDFITKMKLADPRLSRKTKSDIIENWFNTIPNYSQDSIVSLQSSASKDQTQNSVTKKSKNVNQHTTKTSEMINNVDKSKPISAEETLLEKYLNKNDDWCRIPFGGNTLKSSAFPSADQHLNEQNSVVPSTVSNSCKYFKPTSLEREDREKKEAKKIKSSPLPRFQRSSSLSAEVLSKSNLHSDSTVTVKDMVHSSNKCHLVSQEFPKNYKRKCEQNNQFCNLTSQKILKENKRRVKRLSKMCEQVLDEMSKQRITNCISLNDGSHNETSDSSLFQGTAIQRNSSLSEKEVASKSKNLTSVLEPSKNAINNQRLLPKALKMSSNSKLLNGTLQIKRESSTVIMSEKIVNSNSSQEEKLNILTNSNSLNTPNKSTAILPENSDSLNLFPDMSKVLMNSLSTSKSDSCSSAVATDKPSDPVLKIPKNSTAIKEKLSQKQTIGSNLFKGKQKMKVRNLNATKKVLQKELGDFNFFKEESDKRPEKSTTSQESIGKRLSNFNVLNQMTQKGLCKFTPVSKILEESPHVGNVNLEMKNVSERKLICQKENKSTAPNHPTSVQKYSRTPHLTLSQVIGKIKTEVSANKSKKSDIQHGDPKVLNQQPPKRTYDLTSVSKRLKKSQSKYGDHAKNKSCTAQSKTNQNFKNPYYIENFKKDPKLLNCIVLLNECIEYKPECRNLPEVKHVSVDETFNVLSTSSAWKIIQKDVSKFSEGSGLLKFETDRSSENKSNKDESIAQKIDLPSKFSQLNFDITSTLAWKSIQEDVSKFSISSGLTKYETDISSKNKSVEPILDPPSSSTNCTPLDVDLNLSSASDTTHEDNPIVSENPSPFGYETTKSSLNKDKEPIYEQLKSHSNFAPLDFESTSSPTCDINKKSDPPVLTDVLSLAKSENIKAIVSNNKPSLPTSKDHLSNSNPTFSTWRAIAKKDILFTGIVLSRKVTDNESLQDNIKSMSSESGSLDSSTSNSISSPTSAALSQCLTQDMPAGGLKLVIPKSKLFNCDFLNDLEKNKKKRRENSSGKNVSKKNQRRFSLDNFYLVKPRDDQLDLRHSLNRQYSDDMAMSRKRKRKVFQILSSDSSSDDENNEKSCHRQEKLVTYKKKNVL